MIHLGEYQVEIEILNDWIQLSKLYPQRIMFYFYIYLDNNQIYFGNYFVTKDRYQLETQRT